MASMPAFPLVGLESDSDGLHAAGSDSWWREAWYFEFYDPRSQLQFQAYQGVFPNASTGDLVAAFFHRGRLLHQITKMDFNLPPEPAEERLCFGPLKLEMLEPFRRWRLRYDSSEIQADLEFVAVHPPFSWAAAQLWMETTQNPDLRSNHFDQLGRYTGSVWIEGKKISVDALGFRDRMWGWGGRKHWRSYLILWAGFGEDFVANLAVQRFEGGRQSLCGYLHRDGKQGLLHQASVTVEWDAHRWKTVARVDVQIKDEHGRTLEFTGRPQGILDTSHRWAHRHDHMLFSVGEYNSGGRTGYGVMNWAFATEAEKPHRLEALFEPQG